LKELAIAEIRIDGGTQTRAHLNEGTVDEYAELLTDGVTLPPITIYFDGSEYWLADGFHRYFANKKIGAISITADVRNGSCRDAILHSVGANSSHGMRRSNEDKRRAVETLVNDAEWTKWTDREIAKACGVSHPFVAAIRRPAVAGRQQSNRDKSAAKRVESDSTKSKSAAKQLEPADPAPAPLSALESEPAAPDAEQDDAFGPSDEEMAFFEEKEKADQAAYDALVEAALSDDKLGEALRTVATQAEEIGRLKAEIRTLKESRDSHMNAKNEAIRMVKSLQKKLAKYEKAAA